MSENVGLPAAMAISAELDLAIAEAIADAASELDDDSGRLLGIQSDDATTMTGRDLSPGRGRMTLYVAPAAADDMAVGLAALLQRYGSAAAVTQTRIEAEDWNATWKAHFRALDVGERLRIEPPWDRHPPGDRIVVVVDPGMAFGTGSHETTRMAAILLERAVDQASHEGRKLGEMAMLDIGTGSGLLAMAAVQLGIGRAIGVDNDAVAVASAAENVALNDLGHSVTLVVADHPNDLDAGVYSVVVANIISSVLLRLRAGLVARTEIGGQLLLSGVLARERDVFIAAFVDSDLTLLQELDLGEWKGFALRRVR